MNSILAKCIEELKAETPRIDYVLGMLETLAEMGTTQPTIAYAKTLLAPKTRSDEESPILDRYLGGPTGTTTPS